MEITKQNDRRMKKKTELLIKVSFITENEEERPRMEEEEWCNQMV